MRSRDCLYSNEEEESDHSRHNDKVGFVAIKEGDLDREIREERDFIS